MTDLIKEIIEDKIRQVSRGRTVIVFVPKRLLSAFNEVAKEYDCKKLVIEPSTLSGKSFPHFSVCTVINPREADKIFMKEVLMTPADTNGMKCIYEEITVDFDRQVDSNL